MKLTRGFLAALALVVSAALAHAQTIGSVTTTSGKGWTSVYAPDINDDFTKLYHAPYVMMSAQTGFSAERVLGAGSMLSLTDGGAGLGATFAVSDAELLCLGGLTSAADKLPYFTGSGTCGLADLSADFRTFLTTSTSANLRGVLSDEIGTGALVFLGTPADDAVPVGDSASAVTWRAIPNVPAGSVLTYATASNSFGTATDDDVPEAGDLGALALTGDVTSSGLATSFNFADAGTDPALTAKACRFTSTTPAGAVIVCEGDTADAFETRFVVTDPTADRAFTIPNADSNAVQPFTCPSTDKVSAISSTGVVTCTSDAGAAGGGLAAADIDTSAELRAIMTDEVGTGAAMFGLAASMSDDLSCTGSQVVRRNAGDTGFECATISGGSGDSIRVEDGNDAGTYTDATDADFGDSGDINFALNTGSTPDEITASVRADSVALTTDTTGNYAAGDAEAGAALTGDSATAFFSAGTFEDARVDGSLEADEVNPTLGTQTQGNYAAGDGEAGNALTGDSATAFFSSGTIEDARLDGSAEADEVLNSDKGDFTCATGSCTIDADAIALTTDTTGNYVASVADGTGIDGTASGEGATYTPTLDFTEITGAAWGSNNYTTTSFSTDGVDLTWDYTTVDGRAVLSGGGTSPGIGLDDQGVLSFFEEDAGGSNTLTFQPPAAITTSQTCTFEDDVNFIPDSCVGNGNDDGILSSAIDTSAELRSIVTDEVGTGALMFGLDEAMADDFASCTGSQVVRRNAGDTAWECATISAGGLASTDIDTSAELAAIVGDETGSGALVFGTAPDLTISATTETNIESALDTLANLTSIQGHTVTLTGAFIRSGAHSLTLTTTGTTSVTVPTSGTLATTGDVTNKTESFCLALSDETTALTTGTAKVTMRMPYAFVLTAVRASINTVSTSGIPTVDINENGATIMTTNKLTIDANEETSVTAATAAGITDANLADDAEMTFDIDVAGTGTKGLKVCMIGHQ